MHDLSADLAEIRQILLGLSARIEMLRLIDNLNDLYQSPVDRANLYPVAQAIAVSVAAHFDYALSELLPALSRLEDAITHD